MNGLKKPVRLIMLYVLAALLLSPLIVGLMLSFNESTAINQGEIFPGHFTIANYQKLFHESAFIHYLWNSVIVSAIVMVGQVILSVLSAYALTFLNFRFKKAIFVIFMITMMLPFEAEILPNFETLKSLNLVNTYAAMTLPFLASAFGMFMLKTAFEGVPTAMRQLAQLEGLGHRQFLTMVVIPLQKVPIITLALYSFLTTWNMYLWPLIATTDSSTRTIQIGLRSMRAQDSMTSWGLIMAATIITVLPTMLIILFGQRYFKNGMVNGMVK